MTARAAARVTSALRSDVVSGSLLIGAAVVARVWANSPLAPAYEALRTFTLGPAALHLDLPVQSWAADGGCWQCSFHRRQRAQTGAGAR
jgi:NhaA family Na+:H+ antiporter